jgi:tRNA (guanine37-N1)-methyltransferase
MITSTKMNLTKGIRVSRNNAEKVKHLLKAQFALDTKKPIQHQGVIFPVKHLNFDLKKTAFEIVEQEFEDFEVTDEFENLIKKIGLHLSSYDVIGDIAVLEIPEGFEEQGPDLSEALIMSKKNINSVFKKSSAVKGYERVRKYSWLAGENRTETVYKEHGCEFKLDIAKVFFSPRLSYERQRIRDQVNEGEFIIDMFAGIGPYSIVIAKQKRVKIIGFDVNSNAIQYFRENIRINKVGERVRAILGDCRKQTPIGKANRAIMNLPKKAKEYLEVAIKSIKPSGGVIHYYGISPRDSLYEGEIDYIMKTVKVQGRSAQIIGNRIVRSYSPSEVHVAIDVGVDL